MYLDNKYSVVITWDEIDNCLREYRQGKSGWMYYWYEASERVPFGTVHKYNDTLWDTEKLLYAE